MKRTPLYDRHVAAGATMTGFAGYDMPVVYDEITTEHRLVRAKAGLFDLCHMGRVVVRGPDALALVQKSQSNDVEKIAVGRIKYALVLNEDGGVLDDVLVHRRPEDVFIVVNASNRERVVARLRELGEGMDAEVADLSEEMAMIAVQGPESAGIVSQLVDGIDVDAIPYYGLALGTVAGVDGMLTRTGYTGEDGFELYLPAEATPDAWDATVTAGSATGMKPCGLGARDTLRLEAGMPLYGHEIDETINPLEAGLKFGVRLKKPDYVGKGALAAVKAEGPKRRLIGLVVDGKRIPRQGYKVTVRGDEAGFVTSGTWSPTFERGVAMALVDAAALDAGGDVAIDLRGRSLAATVVDLPFYKRDGTGSLNA